MAIDNLCTSETAELLCGPSGGKTFSRGSDSAFPFSAYKAPSYIVCFVVVGCTATVSYFKNQVFSQTANIYDYITEKGQLNIPAILV